MAFLHQYQREIKTVEVDGKPVEYIEATLADIETANRLANFDDANLRRSARAAVAAGARVQRAMELLGDDIPDHLAEAGRLRLEHKQASLEELGAQADPPLTKDAIAGRIRRLLAMADKRAHEMGLPDTESVLTPDLYDG